MKTENKNIKLTLAFRFPRLYASLLVRRTKRNMSEGWAIKLLIALWADTLESLRSCAHTRVVWEVICSSSSMSAVNYAKRKEEAQECAEEWEKKRILIWKLSFFLCFWFAKPSHNLWASYLTIWNSDFGGKSYRTFLVLRQPPWGGRKRAEKGGEKNKKTPYDDLKGSKQARGERKKSSRTVDASRLNYCSTLHIFAACWRSRDCWAFDIEWNQINNKMVMDFCVCVAFVLSARSFFESERRWALFTTTEFANVMEVIKKTGRFGRQRRDASFPCQHYDDEASEETHFSRIS